MKLHFYKRNKGIVPKLLRYYGGGEFNHVSIECNGWVYEAIGGKIFATNGVVVSPNKLTQHQGKYAPDKLVTLTIKSPLDNDLEKWLKEQVGRKYAYKDLLGFVFRWVKGKESQYYCSELAVKAYEIATRQTYELKYSPSALYELAK